LVDADVLADIGAGAGRLPAVLPAESSSRPVDVPPAPLLAVVSDTPVIPGPEDSPGGAGVPHAARTRAAIGARVTWQD
jgi:hypothetical protein